MNRSTWFGIVAIVLFLVTVAGFEAYHQGNRAVSGATAPSPTQGKTRVHESPPTTTPARPGELAG